MQDLQTALARAIAESEPLLPKTRETPSMPAEAWVLNLIRRANVDGLNFPETEEAARIVWAQQQFLDRHFLECLLNEGWLFHSRVMASLGERGEKLRYLCGILFDIRTELL